MNKAPMKRGPFFFVLGLGSVQRDRKGEREGGVVGGGPGDARETLRWTMNKRN